ncbi:uncharacterized protein BT62DRAFT_1003463 [Guyanagaster necrorhizus]|uniref:Uncharacterized protein n=1 Tax=Guyanagaster necrorhizus TaxID=856835 RepID=A0A9P7VXH2_9AGAR|nr:uncharacterized protein BT62DRAFT_1003463 [Guyanagaster necrorhizus MCA 3950]KAG7448749.1 hypothetical protein BT62DRAFT_1003463 [Guyanagaster necrorhizus MCA 3950]
MPMICQSDSRENLCIYVATHLEDERSLKSSVVDVTDHMRTSSKKSSVVFGFIPTPWISFHRGMLPHQAPQVSMFSRLCNYLDDLVDYYPCWLSLDQDQLPHELLSHTASYITDLESLIAYAGLSIQLISVLDDPKHDDDSDHERICSGHGKESRYSASSRVMENGEDTVLRLDEEHAKCHDLVSGLC